MAIEGSLAAARRVCADNGRLNTGVRIVDRPLQAGSVLAHCLYSRRLCLEQVVAAAFT